MKHNLQVGDFVRGHMNQEGEIVSLKKSKELKPVEVAVNVITVRESSFPWGVKRKELNYSVTQHFHFRQLEKIACKWPDVD